MSNEMQAPLEDEIQALVDGRLDPARRAEIENWLAENSIAAARVAELRAQGAAIEEIYAPLLDRPMPDQLRDITPSVTGASPVWRMAAMIALVVAGAAAGWLANDAVDDQNRGTAELTREAVRAHSMFVNEKRHAVEVKAQEEKHLVAWLSRRLDQQLVAPDLVAQGYGLVGGRLLPARNSGPAAQFMYETGTGDRVTLYIEQDQNGLETGFQFTEYDGVSAFWWKDGPLAYVLIGQGAREQLHALAQATQKQFNP